MTYTLNYLKRANVPSFNQLYLPIAKAKIGMPSLKARSYIPLKMTFDDQLKALIFFHLEDNTSEQHLLQILEEDNFACNAIAPKKGSKKAVLRKPSIPGDLNNSSIYTKIFKLMLLTVCQKNMINLEIS